MGSYNNLIFKELQKNWSGMGKIKLTQERKKSNLIPTFCEREVDFGSSDAEEKNRKVQKKWLTYFFESSKLNTRFCERQV